MEKIRSDKFIKGFVFFLIIIYGICGIYSLQYFGISWDEGLGNMFFGERYMMYLQTGQDKYLDFKADLNYQTTTDLDLTKSGFRNLPNHFPPIMDISSAWMMHTFAYSLKLLNPVDAFHLLKIIFMILFFIIYFEFVLKKLGLKIAYWSIIFLLTFPRLWGDMEINPKDIPSMIIFTFVIFAFIAWYENPSLHQAIFVGFLFGCGLGIKANIIFAPIIILLGWYPWKWSCRFWTDVVPHLKNYWVHYLIMGSTSICVYLVSWPYLYGHPERILDYFKTMIKQGDRVIEYVWSSEPLAHIVATMPELMFIFLLIGIVSIFSVKLGPQPWKRLLLIWLIFPILRISIPGQVNFDGIRHFYEFLPAAAIIAAIGINKSIIKLQEMKIQFRRIVPILATIVILTTGFLNYKMYFPYTYIYYNQFVGGLPGAGHFFSGNDATDYWAVSYREGLEWIDSHSEKDAKLYVPVAGWLVEIPRRIWLRPDIELIPEEESDSIFSDTNHVYLMFINRPGYYNDIVKRILSEGNQPVFIRTVAGYPILFIYSYSPKRDI